jgi:16S rRNA G1207 methylase RsmC
MLSILLSDAHRYLRVGGALWVVTHAGLKAYVKRAFQEIFGNYQKVKQGRTHSVARAFKV